MTQVHQIKIKLGGLATPSGRTQAECHVLTGLQTQDRPPGQQPVLGLEDCFGLAARSTL